MKRARIGVMVLGIVLLMFVMAPYVSAQVISGVWFQGKASLKGYEITDGGDIIGKANGSATIYVNILDGANLPEPDAEHYYVTTCIENPEVKGEWQLGQQINIWKGHIYGDENTVTIWDFAVNSDPGMNFYPNINTYPMFYAKMNGSLTKANFKSFACQFWDGSDPFFPQLGSCSITFKTVDSLKVPRGAAGCIIEAPTP